MSGNSLVQGKENLRPKFRKESPGSYTCYSFCSKDVSESEMK